MNNIGHNNPPDPIDEALAPYGDSIEESANWLDGEPVNDEAAMKAVDALIAEIRKAKTELAKAKKSSTAPLHDAWKAEVARWKPTEDDIERRLKGLVALVDPFKRKLQAEKEAIKRAAYEEAQRKEREALEAAAKANPADYEEQLDADRKAQEAIEAKKAASAASTDKVKGLRTVTKYEITDHKAALHWIARNDKDAITKFVDEYVRLNHKNRPIDGVNVEKVKEAF